jgi:hypothetical protein
MMPACKFTTIFIMVCLIQQPVFCQKTALQDIRTAADSIYGLNDLLVNGRTFTRAHPRANGHPFFPAEAFSRGTVFVKGQPFVQKLINYNAQQDELALDVSESMPWIGVIALNDKLVDSFQIGAHLFVHTNTLPAKGPGDVYLEKLFEGKFFLLASHQKKFKAEYNYWNPHGRILTLPPRYLIFENGAFYDVNRRKHWLKYFGEHKTALKKFLRMNKINPGKANMEQLKQVAAFCNGLS